MADSPDVYHLASTIITQNEHLKIALEATDPNAGADQGSQSQRIFVIVSNVAQGVEQACILVLKPRKRDPSTASLLKVIPILPELTISTHKSHSEAADSKSPLLGLPSVQSILDNITPYLSQSEGSESASFSFSFGTQTASANTTDVQGLKDFLTVLRDLLKVAEEHNFSLVTTHQWLSAYTDDVHSLHRRDAQNAHTPLFSRFASGHANQQSESGDRPRPTSPSSDEIRVSACTYNVGGHWPRDDASTTEKLRKWLRPDEDPDLIVIGLQEVDTSSGAYLYYSPAREQAWTKAIVQSLGRHAAEYTKIASKQLVGLMIFVFARSTVQDSITNIATATASVGLGGFVANKGAVGVRLQIGITSICFVNSHLAAFEGEQAMQRRCWDWHEIYKRMRFRVPLPVVDFWETPDVASPKTERHTANPFQTAHDAKAHTTSANASASRQTSKDESSSDSGDENAASDSPRSSASLETVEYAITDHDVVINSGDLNFRLDLSHSEALRLIGQKDYSQMRKFDQLEFLRSTHTLFNQFDEGTINFPPTYKFDKGSDQYDTSEKMRVPAWTDRILWSTTRDWDRIDSSDSSNEAHIAKQRKQGIVLQSYQSIPEIKFSDHRPVRATFLIRIK